MLKMDERFYHRMMLCILGIVAVIILFTFRSYGITWDEELQSQYGLAVVDYYLSGFTDKRVDEIYNLYLYGGMFDGFASLIDRFTPFIVYDTRHLVNAFFGLLGLWGTWRLGRLVGGGAVGLLSLVFLTLTPVFYGHMFNNPKDIPFAAGIIWSLYYMVRLFDCTNGERPYREALPLMFKLAIILGLTLGIRVGGVMVFLFWLVPLGLNLLSSTFKERHFSWKGFLKGGVSLSIRYVIPVAILSYLVMLLCWPWAQQSPIKNPLMAFNEFRNFPHSVDVLLLGKTYLSTNLPWYYVPVYLGIQTPELPLLLLLMSPLVLPFRLRSLNRTQRQGLLLFTLTASVPPLYAMVKHPALYDAVRHFLFVVPMLCVLGALTAHSLYMWSVGNFNQPWARNAVKGGMGVILLLFVGTQIAIMAHLHPYEYIYANRLTGGVAGAYGQFELDYWATSFKEATSQLQAIVAKEGGVPSGKIYRVAICGPWSSAMINLPPNYEAVVANQPAEFFLSTTRWMCQNMRAGKEIIRVERFGVPLAVVKDLRH